MPSPATNYATGSKCQQTAMKAELIAGGPLAVEMYIDADFALYASGVYREPTRDYWDRMAGRTSPEWDPRRCHSGCAPPKAFEWQRVNHPLLVVGYGVTDEPSAEPPSGHAPPSRGYWICQNGWGPRWGEDGYVRVAMGEGSIESAAVAVEPVA